MKRSRADARAGFLDTWMMVIEPRASAGRGAAGRRAPVVLLLAFFVVGSGAGCRQQDGEMPTPAGEHVNKTQDIGQDLLNVAAERSGAVQELREDLANLTGAPPPEHLVDEVTTRLGDALGGLPLTEQTAAQLAYLLYVATAARDLSARQVTVLQRNVSETLTGAGVAEDKAQPVADVIGEIQTAVTRNRKRWWHWG